MVSKESSDLIFSNPPFSNHSLLKILPPNATADAPDEKNDAMLLVNSCDLLKPTVRPFKHHALSINYQTLKGEFLKGKF